MAGPRSRLLVPLLFAAVAGGCSTSAPALRGEPGTGPEPPRAAPGPTFAEVVRSPPDLAWEVSRLLPASDYLHLPASDGGPGVFLTRNGFRYLDIDDMALWYERTATGFSLVEVKKRGGLTNLAECPVFFPVKNCVEQHHLIIATIVSCSLSCSYRIVVFDSHDPFPIALEDPVLSGALKRLVDPWLSLPDLEVRFEKSGSLAGSEQGWADYLRHRFAFIHGAIDRSVKPEGFRLLDAPGR